MQEFKVGDLVISVAGRDMGQVYLVTEILDQNYVHVCEGKNKPIEKPKKKKIKHILSVGQNDGDFEQIVSKKDVDTNSYIKKILKNFENS